MMPPRHILLLVAAFLAGAGGVWALSGGDEEPVTDAPATTLEPGAEVAPPQPPPSGAEPPAGEKETAAEERAGEVARAVRDYVAAISDRDGVVLCGVVDGIADLDLPVRRGGCAESVSESIGYRDPRGYPVFEKSAIAGTPQVELDGARARATVTVVTEFADRDEPSVEDDVVYLVRRGGMWVVAKPSSTLYRAIGVPDIPPDVLEAPQ